MMMVVIFCLAGFSIIGMMSIRSQQLRISIATLEAIGYSRRFVLKWLIFESLLIGLSASVFAICLELIAFHFTRGVLTSTWLIPIEHAASFKWSLIILGEGLVFALLGSAASAMHVFRVSVHQELKSG
jgi:ABC-type lipoprotein release transport system permease subunit